MFKYKRIIISILTVLLITVFFIGCTPEPNVTKIEIESEPTKTQYYVGEEFSAAGGKIKVTYRDGSTEILDMTDEKFTITQVDTTVKSDEEPFEGDNLWRRTITVRCSDQKTVKDSFYIFISHQSHSVTFDYGYDGIKETKNVKKGDAIVGSEPKRENFDFDGWYTDEGLTLEYNFSLPVTNDITLYAKWLDNSVRNYKVVFDYNFYGGYKGGSYTQKIDEGNSAVRLATDPVRTGYQFSGWFTSAAGGTEYIFSTPITQDTTIYAQWTKTVTGTNTWVFGAEYTDLTGKTSPALSGIYTEGSMIQTRAGFGATNDKFVVGLYKPTASLEFRFASDVDVSDAKVILRLSAEMRDMVLTSDIFAIMINGDLLNDYPAISLTGVLPPVGLDAQPIPFADFIVAENVTLKKGQSNLIELIVVNNVPLSGTTVLSIGPLVDCVKVTTSAVLSWDANYDLPFSW